MKATSAPKHLNRSQIARLVGVSTNTVGRWVDLGLFPRPDVQGGMTRRWRAEVVDRWLAEQKRADSAK